MHTTPPTLCAYLRCRYNGKEGILTKRGGFGGWYAKFDVDDSEQYFNTGGTAGGIFQLVHANAGGSGGGSSSGRAGVHGVATGVLGGDAGGKDTEDVSGASSWSAGGAGGRYKSAGSREGREDMSLVTSDGGQVGLAVQITQGFVNHPFCKVLGTTLQHTAIHCKKL